MTSLPMVPEMTSASALAGAKGTQVFAVKVLTAQVVPSSKTTVSMLGPVTANQSFTVMLSWVPRITSNKSVSERSTTTSAGSMPAVNSMLSCPALPLSAITSRPSPRENT